NKIKVVDIVDALGPGGKRLGESDYEQFIAGGDPDFEWKHPADEWNAIALNYTSGTTGDPKGVVYHHRGAYLNALSTIIDWGMQRIGFDITHVYGLTETYGPAAVCAKHAEWDALDIGARTERNGRQGVRYTCQEGMTVMDAETMTPVPWDGETMGEIMFRGNITMKGYLKNPKTTRETFAGGWFHSGDLAVMQPDGYVKIKDRSKDVIISGGENISSLEVEDALYRHPAVLAAAVV